MENADFLKGLLERINEGVSASDLRGENTAVLENIRPSDLAVAEQRMLDSGCSVAILRKNQRRYVDLVGDQLHRLWTSLPYNHIVRRILAEHEIYQCLLSDLKEVNDLIQQKDFITDTSAEFRRLAHISQHLAASREHSEYEEDILYPELRKHSLGYLIRAMKSDHAYIKFAINSLVKLLDDFEGLDLQEFKVRLESVVGFVLNSIREHIFVENYIVLPLSVEIIKDDNVWRRMKRLCDEMGYCGIHDVDI